MSSNSIECDICLVRLPSEKFSKAQVNKLQHNKLKSIHCIECTENIQDAIENERLIKIKDEKKELKRKKKLLSMDPSSKYINQPLNCPTVQDAVNFFKSKSIDFNVQLGKTKEWRTVAKIAVRAIVTKTTNEGGTTSSISTVFGLFKPGTHEVIEIAECNAHHKNINRAIQMVKKACVAAKVNGYVEGTGSSKAENLEFKTYLKYLLFAVERSSGKIQLSLVWNTETEGSNKDGDYFLKSLVNLILKESLGGSTDDKVDVKSTENPLFHSIWVNYNPSSRYDNCITSRDADSWRLLFGSEYVMESINAAPSSDAAAPVEMVPRLRFPPFVFRQANIDAFSSIIHSIRKWIPTANGTTSGAASSLVKCVELYGGVGTIGLNCLDLLSRLSCSDENPHNKVCFELTLAELKASAQAAKKFSHQLNNAAYDSRSASAVAVSGGLRGFDLVLVDPPRKGLDEEVIQALLSESGSLFDSGAASAAVAGAGVSDGNASVKIGGVNVTSAVQGKKKIFFDAEDDSTSTAAPSGASASAATTAAGTTSATVAAAAHYNKRLIYVSCGFKAFKRDCARLLGESVEDYHASGDSGLDYDGCDDEGVAAVEEWMDQRANKRRRTANEDNGGSIAASAASAGGKVRYWKLVHAEGHVLFPGSDHIETFAVFDRV